MPVDLGHLEEGGLISRDHAEDVLQNVADDVGRLRYLEAQKVRDGEPADLWWITDLCVDMGWSGVSVNLE